MARNKDKDIYTKFLAIIDTIMKYSDENHPLTVKEIQEYLFNQGYDFHIDYRILLRYVEVFNDHHQDDVIIVTKQGRNLYFYFADHFLDAMEAKAIIDLVYSSDFFTKTTKENYKKRIQKMFSTHYKNYFQKNVELHVSKNENPQVFYQELEIISHAMELGKKIKFTYQKPSLLEEPHKKIVELAPIETLFSNNEYYLLCQGAKNHKDCLLYRLDYIQDVSIIEDSSVEFTQEELYIFSQKLKNMSYMYGQGDLQTVQLSFNVSIYANIIDHFGKDIHPKKIDDTTYQVTVRHIINSTFYAWIIGFGGLIQITGNQKQVDAFHSFLKANFLNAD